VRSEPYPINILVCGLCGLSWNSHETEARARVNPDGMDGDVDPEPRAIDCINLLKRAAV